MNEAPTKNGQRIAVLWPSVLPERINVRLGHDNHKSTAKEIQFACQWIIAGIQGASSGTAHARGEHVGLIGSYR